MTGPADTAGPTVPASAVGQPAPRAEPTSADPSAAARPGRDPGLAASAGGGPPSRGQRTPGEPGEAGEAIERRPPRRTWPASKRARAAARRRGRALAQAVPASLAPPAAPQPASPAEAAATSASAERGWGHRATDHTGPAGGTPGRGGRGWRSRPTTAVDGSHPDRSPGDRLRRRRAWVLAALATTAVAGAGLAVLGLSVVRNSTAGRYVDPPARPDEPGYQAYVTSTPTLAVVHRSPAGSLAGATVLTLRPGDEGGSVVLVPPSTRMPVTGPEGDDDGSGDGEGGGGNRGADTGDGDGLTVAAAYAGGGADAVASTLSDILGVAIDDVVELDDARWASLVAPVAPVTVSVETQVGTWVPGEVALAATDVGAFLVARSPEEPELDRLTRQAGFWTAWLDRVERGGQGAVPGEIDVGIGRFIRGVAHDPSAAVLPVTPIESGSGEAFAPDDARIPELVSRAVPFPLSPSPGRRVRVRLLNGTPDADLTPAAARQLVEAGAEITIAGNAATFDASETTFAYESSEQRDEAEQLADAFGVGSVEEGGGASESPSATAAAAEDEIDVTIVLGSDAQDLIGRLENAG